MRSLLHGSPRAIHGRGELLPPAVVRLTPPERLFPCAADCPKSHGYVHTLDGNSEPWTLALPTVTPLPCGHAVCVECVAARPTLLLECAQCRTRRTPERPPKRKRPAPKPASPQPEHREPEEAGQQRGEPGGLALDADDDLDLCSGGGGLSSTAAAFFQQPSSPGAPPSPRRIEDTFDVGEICLIMDDTYVHGSYFEVKIIGRRRVSTYTEYRVHFNGWKSRYDKWIRAESLVPLSSIVGEGAPQVTTPPRATLLPLSWEVK